MLVYVTLLVYTVGTSGGRSARGEYTIEFETKCTSGGRSARGEYRMSLGPWAPLEAATRGAHTEEGPMWSP